MTTKERGYITVYQNKEAVSYSNALVVANKLCSSKMSTKNGITQNDLHLTLPINRDIGYVLAVLCQAQLHEYFTIKQSMQSGLKVHVKHRY